LLDQTRDLVAKAREYELKRYKISRVQASVLYILSRENRGISIAEIANWNIREPHSVLGLINRMEKIGLVKKVREEDDDKVKIILTEKGRELYSSAPKLSMQMIFSVLSEKEKQQLKSTLEKVRLRTRELLGLDYTPPF
jgi:DNA-binding MarR family transcriptional regulator